MVGTYAGCSETSCNECAAGQVDSDLNAATPCTVCAAGQHWVPGRHAEDPGSDDTISSCAQCEAGRADLDLDSTTQCTDCSVGTYAATGSSECTSCSSLGLFDDDRDPATPCSDTDICLQMCEAGTQDIDCDETTDCVACDAGTHAVGGVYPESRCEECEAGTTDGDSVPSTACEECSAGLYAAAGHSGDCIGCPAGRFVQTGGGESLDACGECQSGQYSDLGSAACSSCTAGRADDDLDASTPCTDCEQGTYAGCGETSCNECAAGQVDSDLNAATPCTACLAGQYWVAGGDDTISSCAQCEAGRADLDLDSTTACDDCSVGTFCPAGSSHAINCTDQGEEDDDTNPATICRAPMGVTVEASVEVSGSLDDILSISGASERAQFEREFVRDLAMISGIESNRIIVTDVGAAHSGRRRVQGTGGFIVSFQVTPATDGSSLPISRLESALEQAVEIGGFHATEGLRASTQAPTCTQQCDAGMQDRDCDAATPCTQCEPGQYTPGGISPAAQCAYCPEGFADTDQDPATPCEPCAAGFYTETVGHAGPCLQCAAGKFSKNMQAISAAACQDCDTFTYSVNGSARCLSRTEFFQCNDETRQEPNFFLMPELCRPDEWLNQSVLPSQCYECSCRADYYDALPFEINCWTFDKKEQGPHNDILNDASVRDIHAHHFEGKNKADWKSTCVHCPACVDCSAGSDWEQITIKAGYSLALEGVGKQNVLDVFKCPLDGSCLANLSIAEVLDGTNRKCAIGYVNVSSVPFCAACVDGYSMDNNECTRCDVVQSSSVLVLSLMAAALVIGVLGSLRLRFCSHHFQVGAAVLRLMWPRISQSAALIISR